MPELFSTSVLAQSSAARSIHFRDMLQFLQAHDASPSRTAGAVDVALVAEMRPLMHACALAASKSEAAAHGLGGAPALPPGAAPPPVSEAANKCIQMVHIWFQRMHFEVCALLPPCMHACAGWAARRAVVPGT